MTAQFSDDRLFALINANTTVLKIFEPAIRVDLEIRESLLDHNFGSALVVELMTYEDQ